MTPKRRWQIVIFLDRTKFKGRSNYLSYKTSRKTTLLGHKNIRGLRWQHKTELIHFFIRRIVTLPYAVFDFDSTHHPFREFVWAKTLYNHVQAFLHTRLSYPGSKLYPYNYIKETPEKFINQIVPLSEIPINSIATFIFNNTNITMTYAKSSGANAVKRKEAKKLKLTFIELPSGVLKLFPSYTNCILANARNIYLNKVVEGGWGYFVKAKKHIVVRGVAMNPVDHPNGGRTKAKQPELSPWGWIAKKGK